MDEAVAALRVAVAALGGESRSGQEEMTRCIATAIDTGASVAVQAGTGTGKSLAYLVPSVLAARESGRRVVIATATLGLQRQLSERDLPRVLEALDAADSVSTAVLKGRQNYVCLNRVRVDAPEDDGLFEVETGRLAEQVREVRAWIEETTTGDRDDYPGELDTRVWRSLSVSSRECIGEARCSFGQECFSATRRLEALGADIVITNHALVALHASSDMPILPEHDILILDEAHEFVDRVTSAISVELDTTDVRRTLARVAGRIESDLRDRAEDALDAVDAALETMEPGRVRALTEELLLALTLLRDVGHGIMPALAPTGESDAGSTARLRAAVEDFHAAAARILTAGPDDVVWIDQGNDRSVVHVAPLDVGAVLRGGMPATVIATSATLLTSGGPETVIASLGLDEATTVVDVGSPFDFARQGILYTAAHLPAPDRDGISMDALDEMADLIEAAGGRTLGLFSSWRGVERAAEYLRVRSPNLTVHVQQRGESPARVISAFASDERSVLLGTVSLWQGIDVPGRACILVVIDRIPFPRPDDPITSARAERAEARGRSGFMEVSVARAGLLLAQGAGRLIRSGDDRGVVALLDSRMSSARYASAIRAAMPPLWPTSDREVVLSALRRLAD